MTDKIGFKLSGEGWYSFLYNSPPMDWIGQRIELCEFDAEPTSIFGTLESWNESTIFIRSMENLPVRPFRRADYKVRLAL